MTNMNNLVEQHIIAYESSRRRTAELLEQARTRLGSGPGDEETRSQVERLKEKHDELSERLEQAKSGGLQDLRQEEFRQAGPMALWDVLAQDLEKLLERLQRH
jgi:predicted nuclease with TOPRIM domain